MAEHLATRGEVLVYVQAVPLPGRTKGAAEFGDYFQNWEVEMSQASKVALSKAVSLGFRDIMAVGFPSILHEAIARGATEIASVPLCADPLQQAKSFPSDEYSQIFVGDSAEGPFQGTTLVGVLSALRGLKLQILDADAKVPVKLLEHSVVLVRNGKVDSIDVRRIKPAVEVAIKHDKIIGSPRVNTLNRPNRRVEELEYDSNNLVMLVKRLRRITLHSQ